MNYKWTKEEYDQAWRIIREYSEERKKKDSKYISHTDLVTKSDEWYNNMNKEQWDNILKEFGYFGHDIGTTIHDVRDLYLQKFNLKIK